MSENSAVPKNGSGPHTVRARGFTIIELLIVVAIVTVISVVLLILLNPVELMRQSRDASRISDLATLRSALSLYLSDVKTPSMGNMTYCYVSTSTNIASTSGCGVFGPAYTVSSSWVTNPKQVDGTGWIPVNLLQISTGSPIGGFPVDPVNDSVHYYTYAASTTLVFEIAASDMESVKYSRGGKNDVVTPTGYAGPAGNAYVVGTAPGLGL